MNKPSNWYQMDYSEQREWERNKQALEDAEYDRQRAQQDMEDAQARAQQARRNYQHYMAEYSEEMSQVQYELQANAERIAGFEKFVQKFLANFKDCEICDGTGKFMDESDSCPSCDGTGIKLVSRGVLFVELPDEAKNLLEAVQS